MKISPEVLRIDAQSAIRSITESTHNLVHGVLRRKGAVVGVSGGIDSSLCAALCVHALGKDAVLALFMPDRDSSPESRSLAQNLIESLGVRHVTEDITPVLDAIGCYQRQLDAIRTVFPEYEAGWKCKITIPSILESDRLNVSRLTVQTPAGETETRRLSAGAYLQLVAATNMKQRTRKMLEYYHADRLNFAVCGTPNRLEYDQGFFVKNGDGSADFKPIAHLYKSQVYALAHVLGVPEEICKREPTTDTFSLGQSQEEFYFAVPYHKMDLCLYGYNHGIPPAEVAPAAGLTPEQVERVYKDIVQKRRTTLPLHLPPLLVEDIPEIRDAVHAASADRRTP